MKGEAESEEIIFCHRLDKLVPARIVECSEYDDKTTPSLSSMTSIAWVLRTDTSGKKIGFVDPSRYRALVRKGEAEYIELD